MAYRLEVALPASLEIEAAAIWWLEHKPSTPGVFKADLEAAFRMLQRFPHLGPPAKASALKGVRRLNLPRLSHLLYYRVLEEEELVQVLALWHTSRGGTPQL